MPRARLPQLHSITDGSFEPNRRNPIMLGDDAALDSDTKPIKIGDKTSILELSNDNLIIRGSIEFDSLLRGIIDSPNERMAFTAKTGEYRFYSTLSDEDYVRMYVLGGNCLLQAIDASGGTAADINLDAGNDIYLDAATGEFKFLLDGDGADIFEITLAANGVTTFTTNDADGAVGHLTLQPNGDLVLDPDSQKIIINATDKLYFDGGGSTYIYEAINGTMYFACDNVILLALVEGTTDRVDILNGDLTIPAAKKFFLDGDAASGHTYISESSDDVLDIKVGDDLIFQITESGDDGNTIDIDNACIGFTQREPTYDATNTVVDFRHSNKQFLRFGSGNITNLNLYFPLVSGNFVLLVKQDGTGSRTITNYKVFEFDESSADGSYPVKFAGGSAPTLTTDANHVDIISFYWDADNEIAYGVATLDFQF